MWRRAAAASFFKDRGIGDKANATMVVRTAVICLLLAVPYALVLTGVLTSWAALGASVVIGVGIAGLGLAVCHDALHGAYSSRAWVNRSSSDGSAFMSHPG